MNIFKYLFWTLWKVWIYFLLIFIIILLSPFLLVSILSLKTYPIFFKIARLWAYLVFYGSGFRYTLEDKCPDRKNKSFILVANHTSMIDILLMLILMDKNPFVFVGKAELTKVPVFGFFFKRTSIVVDRSNAQSRALVFEEAKRRIQAGLSVCIFPEGGVPDDESILLDAFKDGAFKLAKEHQLSILPVTIYGLKEFFPFRFFSGYPGRVVCTIHEAYHFDHEEAPVQTIKNDVRQLIENQLLAYQNQ